MGASPGRHRLGARQPDLHPRHQHHRHRRHRRLCAATRVLSRFPPPCGRVPARPQRPDSLLLRLPSRHRRAARPRADGFRRLAGGIRGGSLVHVRPSQQCATDGSCCHRARARRARRRHAHHLRAGAAHRHARRRGADHVLAVVERGSAGGRGLWGRRMRFALVDHHDVPEDTNVDAASLDWTQVRSTAYVIQQRISYHYEGPVRRLRQRLMVQPREHHGDQCLVSRSVRVVDASAKSVRARSDDFGNHVIDIEVPYIAERVTFVSLSVVERRADRSTLAREAFAKRAGVCQDYAHVLLALTRGLGLPSRYVSGQLLGTGGSHAWVEVLVPDGEGRARVLALDPTTGRTTGMTYVTIAVGRDYADIAPVSGTYVAPHAGVLTMSKRVTVKHVEVQAGERSA